MNMNQPQAVDGQEQAPTLSEASRKKIEVAQSALLEGNDAKAVAAVTPVLRESTAMMAKEAPARQSFISYLAYNMKDILKNADDATLIAWGATDVLEARQKAAALQIERDKVAVDQTRAGAEAEYYRAQAANAARQAELIHEQVLEARASRQLKEDQLKYAQAHPDSVMPAETKELTDFFQAMYAGKPELFVQTYNTNPAMRAWYQSLMRATLRDSEFVAPEKMTVPKQFTGDFFNDLLYSTFLNKDKTATQATSPSTISVNGVKNTTTTTTPRDKKIQNENDIAKDYGLN